MAITNITLPELVSLARSPIQVKLTSNLPTEATLINQLRLTINGSPAVDETIEITYGNVSETFTVKTAADDSGNTISVQGALTLPAYASLLANEFNKNYNLFSNFDIEYIAGSSDFVRFTPKDLSGTWSYEETLSNIDVDIITSTNAAYQQSPALLLIAVLYNRRTLAYDIQQSHILPIVTEQEEVTFDINKDFDLAPHLPAPASIGIGGDYIAECVDNWIKYQLYYADRAGIPAITSALQTDNEEYFAIFGGNSFFHQYDEFWSFWEVNGKFLTAQPRTQTVTYQQPMWLYWVGRVTKRILKIAGTAYRRSGATESFERGEIEETKGEVIVLKAGFDQLQLPNDGSDPIIKYEVYLKAGSDRISEIFTYNITAQLNDWTRYFLFANSLGGCDTIRATGKHTTSQDVIAQSGSRITNADTIAKSKGEDFQYDRRSRTSYQGSVGYKSKSYIAYLQDLLNAPAAWIIDINASRYNPILIAPGSINLFKDDEDLSTLTFSYTHAWEEAHLGITDDGNRIIVTENENG
jgi:hypothetical protein